MYSKQTKIIVDISMTIFLLLSFIRWDGTRGAAYHFSVGTACALFFAAHVFIHRKWIKACTKSLFAGKLSKTLRGKYAVDILLLIFWTISIITGFIAIPPFFNDMSVTTTIGRIHGITARIGLVLVIIHIIQHIPIILSYMGLKQKKR